jgi:hypothetical protein
VVIAASFDDIIAITGFSIFINIAIAGGQDAAWQIASGPLQVGRWDLQALGQRLCKLPETAIQQRLQTFWLACLSFHALGGVKRII